ncbi:unnamed protein product [Camellia sinensis]
MDCSSSKSTGTTHRRPWRWNTHRRIQLVKKLNRSTTAIPYHLRRPTKPPSSATANPQKQTQHPTPKSMNSLILSNSVSEFIEQNPTRLCFKRHGTALIRLEEVGIDLPTIEVRFEHLNVNSEAYVGGRALPTILNFSINILEKPLAILHNVSGIIKPGRMALLLGPPSSGKTSLLLALAGKLDSDLKVRQL